MVPTKVPTMVPELVGNAFLTIKTMKMSPSVPAVALIWAMRRTTRLTAFRQLSGHQN